MKKLKSLSLYIGLAMFLPVVSANAVSYSIEHYNDGTGAWDVSSTNSATGTFDLTAETPSFDPLTDVIDSVILTFTASNPAATVPSFFSVNLDGVNDGFGVLFQIGGAVVQNGVGSVTANLQADGILNWSVDFIAGQAFTLDAAKLVAETTPGRGASQVPDGGGTLLLLGLALAGFGVAKSKSSLFKS